MSFRARRPGAVRLVAVVKAIVEAVAACMTGNTTLVLALEFVWVEK